MKVDNMQTGFGKVRHKVQVLNTRQYLDMRYEAFKNDGAVPTYLFLLPNGKPLPRVVNYVTQHDFALNYTNIKSITTFFPFS